MPEIAEVEIVRRRMAPLIGRTIEAFTALDPKWERADMIEALTGARVRGIRRHGKLLGVDIVPSGAINIVPSDTTATVPATDGSTPRQWTLAYHLMMAGNISWSGTPANTRGYLDLRPVKEQPDRLALVDPRHFATLALMPADEWATHLGPDLWQADLHALAEAILAQRARASIKATLLSQSIVAGIGNYLADEALWRCGLHPSTPCGSLDASAIHCALTAAKETSQAALALKTPEVGPWPVRKAAWRSTLHAYSRGGKECHRCGTELAKGIVAGRGSVWCPTCQVLPGRPGAPAGRRARAARHAVMVTPVR